MTSSPLVCRRCGFTNVPGDQFCGSCGAFLEWEGEQAPGTATPPATPVDPDVPVVGAAGGPSAGWGTAPTTPITEPVPTTQDPGLIRCPACGIANSAVRTFCQSCGTKLSDAGRVAPVTSDQIAAAVNERPVTVTTTTIRPKTAPEASGSGGGVAKWIAIMVGLGLLVGIGIVVVGGALRGPAPSPDATSRASGGVVEVSPSPTVVPSESLQAPTDAPTPTPTPGPKAERLALLGATASSVVGDLAKFQPTMAIDGDPDTCWQEGADVEKGQWIEVVFVPSKVTAVILTNGYNVSSALYNGNRRLKDIEIKVGDAAPQTVRLKDTGTPQKIDVKNVSGAVSVRITIVSTYPSVKTKVSGTPFDDTALGEIVVMGIPGS